MIRTILASLRYRKARLALSGLAICLGVACVSGTLVLGASMTQAYFDSFAAGAKNVSAAVSPATGSTGSTGSTGKGRPGAIDAPSVPASLLANVSAVPGVAAAAGRLVGQAPLIGGNGKAISNGEEPGFGINVPADPALQGFTVASGHLPDAASQVVVDKATAADQHFRLGQTVRVVAHNGVVRAFVLVGTIDLGVNHEFGSSTVTSTPAPIDTAMVDGVSTSGPDGMDAPNAVNSRCRLHPSPSPASTPMADATSPTTADSASMPRNTWRRLAPTQRSSASSRPRWAIRIVNVL